MSTTRSELVSPVSKEVFTSRGPSSEGPIASSIANMLASNRNREFEIWENDRSITLEFSDGVLRVSQHSPRSEFWLNRIVAFMMHRIPVEYFRGTREPFVIHVERMVGQTLVVTMTPEEPMNR